LRENGIREEMTTVDRPVIRMFTCDPDTVRWETRIVEGRGLELKVFGPGALRRDYAFGDAMSLVEYQVQYERQLLLNGYTVIAHSERRAGYDRRRRSRTTDDRRRR
jgi:hypothetical protein